MATESTQINQSSPKVKLLHLRPKSDSTQRIWCVGRGSDPSKSVNHSELHLAVAPQQNESFASLKSILEQLKPLSRPEHRNEIKRVEGYLREACPDPGAGGATSHGQMMADSVAFAIMRRISRESFYTARVIELGAQTINAILSGVPGCQRVYVSHLDQLDRPTLKVLARAMLLLEPSHGFSWVWHSTSDPLQSAPLETEDIYLRSRHELLRQLVGILSPTLVMQPGVEPLTCPGVQSWKPTTFDIAAALVVQNYDACFLWCDSLLGGRTDAETAEGHRLRALAAVNVGKYDDALRSLRLAEEMSASAVRRAHLSYLQGLIETKRLYDLSGSNSHYTRGLCLLDGGHNREDEDSPMERAWLMNGLALNEAVMWRRHPGKREHFSKAFALERDAFALVRDGESPARTYLRFNLLANSAFLLEMSGNYELAINTFLKVFDFNLDESLNRRQVWRSTLGYRVGVLHHCAGKHDEALRLLSDAAEHDSGPEGWPTQERILRALGAVLLHQGHYSRAADAFAKGLEQCRTGRSAQGTSEHARNLIVSLLRDGQERRAREVYEELLTEEGLDVVPAVMFAPGRSFDELRALPLSPKLPAYFPELDLEGIPSIDLNLFLGKPEASGNGQTSPWSF
jgi:tetratricopeptide (TPR) repeat protein